jgi:hypothetical protein
MRPKIYMVVPSVSFTVQVFFDDRKVKLYDAKPLLEKGGVFDILKNKEFFETRCTVMNGTLAWDVSGDRDESRCIDICPDTIYEFGLDVNRSDVA